MPKIITTNTIIKEFVDAHGSTYDYSETFYKNAKTKVSIICKKHGAFWQLVKNHREGKGCPKCAGNLNKNTTEVILDFKNIHGDTYDYQNVDYVNSCTKVEIICKEHGSFYQFPSNHSNGNGCPECKSCKKYTRKEIISAFTDVHGDKYDYTKINYTGANEKVSIICPKHGVFKQRASSHRIGQGCPMCAASLGENRINAYLNSNKYLFNTQKTFESCKNIRLLRFDFYIKKLNLIIEFNGIQHYKPIRLFGGVEGYKQRMINDKIKSDYCESEGIRFLVLSYCDIDNIECILNKELRQIK
jgi:hypothetical protein